MMNRLAATLACLAVLALASPSSLSQSEAVRAFEAEVTYVSGASVYIDAGENAGIRVDDRVEVLREGGVLMVLRVKEVSARRASCESLDPGAFPTSLVKVGDRVRFVPRPADPPAPVSVPDQPGASEEPAKKEARRARRPWRQRVREAGVRGRVGLGYLAVRDRSGDESGFSQPFLSLRLDGRNVGGSDFGFHVDARARRTYRDADDQSVNRNRVYRLNMEWAPRESPYRAVLGRQYAPAISGISLFDGFLGERRGERWNFGLFGGTQPEPSNHDLDSDVKQYGAFAQLHNRSGSAARWNATFGLIGAYEESEISREFLYLQGRYVGGPFSAMLTQEIDVNRGWKSDTGSDSLSPTSTFLMMRYKVSESLTLNAGFDDRERVRLYRDRETPETDFDDRNRQGLWGGVALRFLDRYRVALRYRGNSGSNSGSSDALTLTARADRISSLDLAFRGRATRYENEFDEGWLYSFGAELPVTNRARVSLFGGLRDEKDLRSAELDRELVWYGIDFEIVIGRAWFAYASLERNTGDEQDYDQLYTTIGYRF
jgi:hypothetical protein